MPPPFRQFAVPHLENKAEKLLREQFGDGYALPIDPELILEKIEDVDLDYWPRLAANHGIDGAVFFDVDDRTIRVFIDDVLADSERLKNRYRMTVAEELAHVLLHGDVIRGISSIDDFREIQRRPDWPDIERDAKRFAAAILMPGSRVTKEANRWYAQLVQVAGFNDIEVIQKYLRNRLATDFAVSTETMHIRLREWPMRIYDRVESAMNARLDFLS